LGSLLQGKSAASPSPTPPACVPSLAVSLSVQKISKNLKKIKNLKKEKNKTIKTTNQEYSTQQSGSSELKEIQSFPGKQKIKKFITARQALQ